MHFPSTQNYSTTKAFDILGTIDRIGKMVTNHPIHNKPNSLEDVDCSDNFSISQEWRMPKVNKERLKNIYMYCKM